MAEVSSKQTKQGTSWRIEKSIPVSVILTLAVYAISFVWVVSDHNTRISRVERDVTNLETVPAQLAGMNARMDAVIQRLDRIVGNRVYNNE